MNKISKLENYLSISTNKFGIYLFDTKTLKNLYKDELFINGNEKTSNSENLQKFLDKNIFKIEKLSGKFIKNIFVIFENKNIFNIKFGIKKKNYNTLVTKQYLENLLIESKDLFRENYHDQEIMHMIINKYFFNEISYPKFKQNIKCDYLSLEIQFKSISNKTINDLNKILENFQIKIVKFVDKSYLQDIFNQDMELSEMSHKILNGYNENEVTFEQKNRKKLGFFEKFFQLFS